MEVVFLVEATKAALRWALLAEKFHVLHYMGHGSFDVRTGRGGLLFEDQQGNPDVLTGQALETILQGVNELQLVLLNACDTARTPRKEGQDSFARVATALVMGGLLAVMAMQFPISDKAAIAFSEVFYPRLAAGDPVDAAVTEGRLAIYSANTESLGWGTPVLYMRSPHGLIFVEEARRSQRLASLYAEARRLHRAQHWQSVIDVFESIKALEPDYPDPDGLLASARKELAAAEAGRRLYRLVDGLN